MNSDASIDVTFHQTKHPDWFPNASDRPRRFFPADLGDYTEKLQDLMNKHDLMRRGRPNAVSFHVEIYRDEIIGATLQTQTSTTAHCTVYWSKIASGPMPQLLRDRYQLAILSGAVRLGCGNISCPGTGEFMKLNSCSVCKESRYCSVACQHADWSKHRTHCRAHATSAA
jgi:hypothetical protein